MQYTYERRAVWYRYIHMLCAKPLSRFDVWNYFPGEETLTLRRRSDGAEFTYNGGAIASAAYNVLGGRWQ